MCAAPGSYAAPEGPSLSGVVRLIGKGVIAHACPITGGLLVTNAHVAREVWTLRWSDGSGNEGVAKLLATMDDADLAVFRVTRGKVDHEYEIGPRPAPGDRAYVRGYRSDGRKNVLAERYVATRVSRLEAGHVVFEDDAKPGSSGSCVFNERGEVFAINAAGLGTGVQNEQAGLAVGIWGEWAEELRTAGQ